MANYRVNNKAKQVKVIIEKITPEERKIIEDYRDLFQYELIPVKSIGQKKINKDFTAEAIQNFLKENGKEGDLEQYWNLYNRPVINKDTGEVQRYERNTKNHKKDKVKVCGHVSTLKWFKENYPDYPNKK